MKKQRLIRDFVFKSQYTILPSKLYADIYREDIAGCYKIHNDAVYPYVKIVSNDKVDVVMVHLMPC